MSALDAVGWMIAVLAGVVGVTLAFRDRGGSGRKAPPRDTDAPEEDGDGD